MARSAPKFTPEQREALYTLKRKGLSGTQTAEALAAGYEGLEPFAIPISRVNAIYRQMALERDELFASEVLGKTTRVGLDALIRRTLRIVERELTRQDELSKKGRADVGKLSKLAGALDRIERLVERVEREAAASSGGKKGDAPPSTPRASTFAERLQESQDGKTAPEPAQVGDVVMTANGGTPGRPPRIADPVPPTPDPSLDAQGEDNPDQDTGSGLGVSQDAGDGEGVASALQDRVQD